MSGTVTYHSCHTDGETEAWREVLVSAQGHIEGVEAGVSASSEPGSQASLLAPSPPSHGRG